MPPLKSLAATSELSLASIRTIEKLPEMTSYGASSMTSICYRYFHSKNLPTSCDSQDQKLSLEFSHEGELPYPKEKVREFWKMLDSTFFLAQPEKRSTKKSKRSRRKKKAARPEPPPPGILTNPIPSSSDQDCTYSSSSTKQSSAGTELMADPPALATLKMLMERGVDQAAFAIRSNYPLQPTVCSCGQQCCLCILFSPHWEVQGSRFESQRRRLLARGKLKEGEDPFPVNARQAEPPWPIG